MMLPTPQRDLLALIVAGRGRLLTAGRERPIARKLAVLGLVTIIVDGQRSIWASATAKGRRAVEEVGA